MQSRAYSALLPCWTTLAAFGLLSVSVPAWAQTEKTAKSAKNPASSGDATTPAAPVPPAPGDCCTQRSQDSHGRIRADVESLRDAIQPHGVGVDIGFWSVSSSDTQQVELQYHVPSAPQDQAQGDLYNDLSNLLTHPNQSGLHATTFGEYMAALKLGKDLPADLRLTLLARMGGQLSDDYDEDMAEEGDLTAPKLSNDAIFQNAREFGKHGGICGNIHEFVRHAASALGFEAYSMSTIWRDARGSGGHVVTGYRDPKTGDIYVQNYNDIVKVGHSSGSGPRDIAEAANLFLNGQAATSFVEDEQGHHDHLYLTNTGKLILDSIRRAEAVIPNTGEGARVTVTLQSNYRNVGYSQFFGKKQKTQLFFGSTTLGGSSVLPAFKQNYVGLSRASDLGGKIPKTPLRYDVHNRVSLGVQSVERNQLTPDQAPTLLQEQSLFVVENLKAKISYTSPDKKSRIAVGTEVEVDLLDASLNKNRTTFLQSNMTTPYHWVKDYLSVSKKISPQMNVGVTVSEVRQITPGQLTQYFPLDLKRNYSTVEVEVIKSGKRMFLRSAGTLYVLPEDGTAMTATVDWVQKLRQQKGSTITAFGSGTVGFNPTQPEDQWFKMKDYATGRIGINSDRKLPNGAVLSAGGGLQYQGNTPTNSFDVQQQQQISQFLTNPAGGSGFVYLKLKF